MKTSHSLLSSVLLAGNETVKQLPVFKESYLSDQKMHFLVDTFSATGWDNDRYARLYWAGEILSACRIARIENHPGAVLFFQRIFHVPIDADTRNLGAYPVINTYGEVLEKYFNNMVTRGKNLGLAYYEDVGQAVAAWVIGGSVVDDTPVKKILEEQLEHLINIETLYSSVMKSVFGQLSFTNNKITADLNEQIRKEINQGFAELKTGLAAIYQEVVTSSNISNSILNAIHQNRVEQGDAVRMLDAIRRSLQHFQTAGIPIDNTEIQKSIARIEKGINSDTTLQQKIELALPIVPFLLDYKLEIGSSIDLEKVMREVYERVRNNNR